MGEWIHFLDRILKIAGPILPRYIAYEVFVCSIVAKFGGFVPHGFC